MGFHAPIEELLTNRPLAIGPTQTATRIVCPPMAIEAAPDGLPSAKTFEHYRRIAENPLVGLIITEHAYVDPAGKASPRQLSFASDDVVGPQRQFVAMMHQASPRVPLIAQISHAGANTDPAVTGQELVSAGAANMRGSVARELTREELGSVVEAFAAAARRVKDAGYDGVEVHAAHGYLLNEFYSPLVNVRSDEYGPSTVEDRTRLICSVLHAVREAVGEDLAVAVRFGGADFMEHGSTIADAAAAAPLLQDAGADLIDVSGGLCVFTRPGHTEPGYFSDLSRAVRDAVGVPVLVTGGIREPEQAEEILRRGDADLVGVGRALLRDPKWGMGS